MFIHREWICIDSFFRHHFYSPPLVIEIVTKRSQQQYPLWDAWCRILISDEGESVYFMYDGELMAKSCRIAFRPRQHPNWVFSFTQQPKPVPRILCNMSSMGRRFAQHPISNDYQFYHGWQCQNVSSERWGYSSRIIQNTSCYWWCNI